MFSPAQLYLIHSAVMARMTLTADDKRRILAMANEVYDNSFSQKLPIDEFALFITCLMALLAAGIQQELEDNAQRN